MLTNCRPRGRSKSARLFLTMFSRSTIDRLIECNKRKYFKKNKEIGSSTRFLTVEVVWSECNCYPRTALYQLMLFRESSHLAGSHLAHGCRVGLREHTFSQLDLARLTYFRVHEQSVSIQQQQYQSVNPLLVLPQPSYV
jgi:hypothetical protein